VWCTSLKSCGNNHLKHPEQHGRIADVWGEVGLDKLLENNVCHSDNTVGAKINAKCPRILHETNDSTAKKQRDSSVTLSSCFDKVKEDAICQIVSGLARLGHPLEKGDIHNICNECLKKEGPSDLFGERGASMATTGRMHKDDGIGAKKSNNPIDPKRAADADPQAFDFFFINQMLQ